MSSTKLNEGLSVDTSGLTLDTARERCQQAIDHGFNADCPVLVDALPAMGKSRGVVRWTAETGSPLTVFTSRHDLYDQYAEWCEQFELTYHRIPAFHKDCETAHGDHGDEWKKRVRGYYNTGLSANEIHNGADRLFGESLPCQAEDKCSFLSKREFTVGSEIDVLIGHYKHAYASRYVSGRYVAFDEIPAEDFLREFDSGEVSNAIKSYLAYYDGKPFQSTKLLRDKRWDPIPRHWAKIWLEDHNPRAERDTEPILSEKVGTGHSDAAAMIYALTQATELENGWEVAQLPDGRTAVHSPDEKLTFLNPPALDEAESVVALDGTPTVAKWKLILGPDLVHNRVLTDNERGVYLRDILKLRVIQTTDEIKPYAARHGKYVTSKRDLALFEGIALREKRTPALITTKTALQKYKEEELTDVVGKTDYYGNIKGTNEFEGIGLGIIAGSLHYGDNYIQRWGALAGKSVIRNDGKGIDLSYGEFGDEILQGIRENEVLQAVMRFGRGRKEGATVYVHTAALPEWVERTEGLPSVHPWANGMIEVIDTVRELAATQSEWKTTAVDEKVSISRQQTLRHLKNLAEYGYLNKQGRKYVWSDQNLGNVGKRGHVEFDQQPLRAEGN